MVIPVESEVAMTPMARELEEMTAIAASLLIRLELRMRKRKKAASITTGMETFKGAKPKATATDKAPKETWESPSPIME